MAAPGSIKRLNVAVLVNDDVNATQQDSIMRTVSSAAGINQDRGDTISVEPLPFSTELKDKRAAEEKAAKDKADRIFYMEVAAALLVLALIIGALMMRRRRKLQEQAALEEQQRLEEEERQRLAAERAKKVESGELEEEELTEEEQRHLTEKQTLQELIDQKPAEVAMLIKTWLSEDE